MEPIKKGMPIKALLLLLLLLLVLLLLFVKIPINFSFLVNDTMMLNIHL
jgi:hypothetical protein